MTSIFTSRSRRLFCFSVVDSRPENLGSIEGSRFLVQQLSAAPILHVHVF